MENEAEKREIQQPFPTKKKKLVNYRAMYIIGISGIVLGTPLFFFYPEMVSGLLIILCALFFVVILKNDLVNIKQGGKDNKNSIDYSWERFVKEISHNKKLSVFKKSLEPFFVKFLIPKYSEVSLFLMSLVFALLFLTNQSMRETISTFRHLKNGYDFEANTLVILFFLGLILSIYHAFSNRKKSSFEKHCMIIFAIVVNFYAAISAGFYLYSGGTQGYLFVFPLWNIISALFLMVLFDAKVVGIKSISDENSNLQEIIFSSLVIVIIFLISQYAFRAYWAITFSVAVSYASLGNDFFKKYFIKT